MRRVTLTLLLVTSPCAARAGPEPVLCRATAHPMRYYLVEPAAKAPGPVAVLVCLAGADGDFAGTARRFARARGDWSALIVVPCTFSSTNALGGALCEHYRTIYDDGTLDAVAGRGPVPDVRARLAWDEDGLLAVLAELRQTYDIEPRIHLTGFSGGGILTYWLLLRHPEKIAAAAAVCANFAFWTVGQADVCPGDPSRRTFPVHILSGERDPLRHSRIDWPMPPVWATLLLGLPGTAAAAGLARKRRKLRWAAGVLGVGLVTALVAGRLSGNDEQNARAVRLLRATGYTNVNWMHIPGMHHEPAPARVVAVFRGR